MDEKAIDSSVPLLPLPMLKARVQLWHWSENAGGWSVELNSQLALLAMHHAPPNWEVCLVERPDSSCLAGQTFVAIETEFVHTKIVHNDPMAQREWNTLWKVILEFTPKFFEEIRGRAIIVKMMSPNFLQQGERLFISIETYGPLKLREQIVPTRRPNPGWLARWKNRFSIFLTIASYTGFIPWSFTARGIMVMEATSSILGYMSGTKSLLLSNDPVQRVAQTLGKYRNKYAAWNDYMSETQQMLCPDIGIRRIEACRNMLIAFGEFEQAILSHLTENIEPSLVRSGKNDLLLKAGAAVVVLGAVVGLGAWWLAYTATSYCGGFAAVAGAISTVVGYDDPNRSARILVKNVRDLLKSLKEALHKVYIRMWASFYRDDLEIPFDQMSEEERLELLKSCGVDLAFIQETDYREVLVTRALSQLQNDNDEFMVAFRKTFTTIGQEMIFQDVPAE
ncbi:uncharacterized protein N7503_003584 [Penicillium pulvis]|uniref:uncharacterized protein n=1 Tax=Penicillium pulvis TaxID=1562058 RepID=UPI0025498B53|nr:uncharacterized protein N7503_003584 [Penicillium pulvis]KAJ5805982.1 hypothetical protein N7503_003584 [Penicillium pulvis]